jgi:hypothetical protein
MAAPNVGAIVDVAQRYVGLAEDPFGSNRTTLVAELDRRYGPVQLANGSWINRDGQEWCASAIAAWHHEAAGWPAAWSLEIVSFYTPSDRNRWRSLNQWSTFGVVGDHIYLDWDRSGQPDHVGLIVEDLGASYRTVEGNLNHMVQSVVRPKNDSRIMGFGRPIYSTAPPPPPSPQEDDDMAVHLVRSDGSQPECLLVNGRIVGFTDPGERDRALQATGAGTWIVESDAQWETILRAHL